MSGDRDARSLPSPIPHPRSRARRAFTLIEMLVVISIICTLLAIAIGGLLRKKATNRLLATEQLIADFVRQARHTARSSGAPVVLRIAPADPADPTRGWTVSGVSRSCIWSESWDDGAAIGPTITLGVNGYGRTAIDSGTPQTASLSRAEQLVRGRRQDGFYLACAVKPLLERGGPSAPPGSVLPLPTIPLLLIGAGGDDQITSSLAGLMLFAVDRPLQPRPTGPGSVPQPHLHCYELLGWVHPYDPASASPPAEAENEVSSIDPNSIPMVRNDPRNPGRQTPVFRDSAPLHPSFSAPDLDVAGPIGVDRWEELGLLFDGEELTLYRNGQRVGSRAYSGRAGGLPDGKDTIFVGQATLPGGGTVYSGANAVFDDARLYRLGTDQLGSLPSGVVASAPLRVTVHPDGRVDMGASTMVEIGRRAGAGSGNQHQVLTPANTTESIVVESRNALVFSLHPAGAATRQPGALNAAVISIASDGTVTSSMATWEQEAGAGGAVANGGEWPVLVTP